MAEGLRDHAFLSGIGNGVVLQEFFYGVVILDHHALGAVLRVFAKELCGQVPVAQAMSYKGHRDDGGWGDDKDVGWHDLNHYGVGLIEMDNVPIVQERSRWRKADTDFGAVVRGEALNAFEEGRAI